MSTPAVYPECRHGMLLTPCACYAAGRDAGRAAAVAEGNAERELIYDDLGRLADMLGLGGHARPYPARQLFGECLSRVADLLLEKP